jgi:ATP-dependent Clp protease ATP-binding subunit ClpB
LNRLDEIVFYKPLTKENINGIVDLLIADLNKRLKDKQVNVKVSDNAKQFIIDSAYDPTYGARPLKRFIQSKIETLLARAIIGGNVEPETTLEIDCENSALVIK